jgi:hypothetical protein
MVHVYERYAWMATLISVLFLCALGGKAGYDINAQKSLEDTGRALSADILGFGGIVLGSFTGVGPAVISALLRPMLTNGSVGACRSRL